MRKRSAVFLATAVFTMFLLATGSKELPAQGSEVVGQYDHFTLVKQVDPIDDEVQYIAATMDGPDDPQRGDAGMAFHCTNDLKVMAFSLDYVTLDDHDQIRMRFDRGNPLTARWRADLTGLDTTLMTDNGAEVVRYLHEALSAERLWVRDADGGTYEFGLNGLTEAVAHMPCFEGQ
jgi:hypothetical protein